MAKLYTAQHQGDHTARTPKHIPAHR